jgi:hypothetical protein
MGFVMGEVEAIIWMRNQNSWTLHGQSAAALQMDTPPPTILNHVISQGT